MISCKDFAEHLQSLGIEFITGVPDSTFKGLISYFNECSTFKHITASNECEAMGIGAGIYLSTDKPALIYMQNSGFGKTINPYTSLFAKGIYEIPAIVLIGWRGKPGVKDEPQHLVMGRLLTNLLDTLEFPFEILSENNWEQCLTSTYQNAISRHIPHGLVVPPGLFEKWKAPQPNLNNSLLTRERAIKLIVGGFDHTTAIVSTTGKTSRELYEIRINNNQQPLDFYTVGSMGCASSIGLGIALSSAQKQIVIIDGDGAGLMQLGTMATIGNNKPENLVHILIDNNAHDSTGGQKTSSDTVDFEAVAKNCGYTYTCHADSEETLMKALSDIKKTKGLWFLSIQCKLGTRSNLGRPTTTPVENKIAFMKHLKKD